MNKTELFRAACDGAHKSSVLLAELVDVTADHVTRDQIAEVNHHLRAALCAGTSLESQLAGNPPPKQG